MTDLASDWALVHTRMQPRDPVELARMRNERRAACERIAAFAARLPRIVYPLAMARPK